MSKPTLLLFCLLCVNAVSARSFLADTLALNSAYAELKGNPSDTLAQRAFVEAFPGSWPEFITTYDYSDKPGYDLSMYHQYDGHCKAFAYNLNDIDDKLYCRKLVELAVGARIDADAPNELNQMQHSAMKSRTLAMLEAITSMVRGDRILYWQFYWSTHLPSASEKQEFIKLKEYMNQNGFSEETEIMSRAFNDFHGKSAYISSLHVGQRRYEGGDF